MKIEIKYDYREIRQALERLRKAGANLEPAMREIAGHLVDGVHEAFERQESPDGTPWAPLKPSTKKERRRKRYRDGPVLERLERFDDLVAGWADSRTDHHAGRQG